VKAFLIGLLLTVCVPAASVSLAENQNFCAGGSPRPLSIPTWGTYCDKGDAALGRATTHSFRWNGPFDIYLSGNPGGAALNLELENLSDHQIRDIRPNVEPGPYWRRYTFDLPTGWGGKDLRLVATDQSTGSMGWLAFSMLLAPRKAEARQEAFRLLTKAILFACLLFLPGFSACAVAVACRVRGTLKLGMLTFAGIAVPGYLLFFLYLLSPEIAFRVSRYVPWVCGGLLLFLLIRFSPYKRRLLLPFLVPFALVVFASIGNLAWGYMYGGTATPTTTAWNRFSHPLPPDNTLPFLFAEGLRKGGVPKPMFLDWLSSDRPPLQTGMVLALEPWMESETRHELWYQVVSALAQSLWIFAVWLLLRAFRISALTTAAVIVTISLSGFAIVNTFFVWPKLLAGAYLIAFATPILAARRPPAQGKWLLRIVMAFLLACSLLSHGGSVFALLGLVLWMAIRYRKQMLRESCFVFAFVLLFYSPWIAYQKMVDPPGDRLLKYHLAGVHPVTHEGALPVILAAYRQLTFQMWWDDKMANIKSTFGHEPAYLALLPKFLIANTQAEIRADQFFFSIPTLGLTGFGLFCLLFRRRKKLRRTEMVSAEKLLLWSLLSTIPWVILMFDPGITVIHAGAYAIQLAAMAGCILALRSVIPRLALVLCATQCIFSWIVYTPDLAHIAFPNSLNQTTNHWMLGLHLLSLWSLLAVLARSIAKSTHRRNALVATRLPV
jgi:hypothetical protein